MTSKNFSSPFTVFRSLKPAFTLAEVLITLGIIGVIAALTIPTLVANYQKKQYVTGLKKVYTQMNQALRQLTADYGCVQDLYCTGVYLTYGDANTFGDAIVKYFKVIKNCRTTDSGCFFNNPAVNIDGSDNGGTSALDSNNFYRFITADGISFAFTEGEGYDCEEQMQTFLREIISTKDVVRL